MNSLPEANGVVIEGHAYAMFAFDIGFQVDLDVAAGLVREATRLRVVRARRPAPVWFDYAPAPLRISVEGTPVGVGAALTEAAVDLLVYDFGAALVTYRLALPGSLGELPGLSVALYEHAALERDAREHAQRVLETIRPAVERPRMDEGVEDYAVFAVTRWPDGVRPARLLEEHRQTIARAIEAETATLAEEQAHRSTQGVMSYTEDDMAIVDWNSAVLFDAEPGDVIGVLQHANIELLELRTLDRELDEILDHADETLGSVIASRLYPSFGSGRLLRRFASVQTDAAVMFEGVNNAIKLLGNQYLARVYRMSAQRMDLPSWQSSVQRKLDATESLYQKMSDATGTKRLETLEWVIILLIAVSIVLPFTPLYH
ncbi:MAG: hypothetical protein Tsb0013_04930 [Phycisphaerales bacterium]